MIMVEVISFLVQCCIVDRVHNVVIFTVHRRSI